MTNINKNKSPKKKVLINDDQAHTDRIVTNNFRASLNTINQDTLTLKGSLVIYSSEPQRPCNTNSRNDNVRQDPGQTQCDNR